MIVEGKSSVENVYDEKWTQSLCKIRNNCPIFKRCELAVNLADFSISSIIKKWSPAFYARKESNMLFNVTCNEKTKVIFRCFEEQSFHGVLWILSYFIDSEIGDDIDIASLLTFIIKHL